MAELDTHNDWQKLILGDRDAFMRIYEKHYQSLYGFGFSVSGDKELVKDAIHEVFCELWDNRENFPLVQNEKSYLMTYLKRKILRELDKKKIVISWDETSIPQHERSYEALLIEQQADDHDRLRLRDSLRQLSPGQLEIIKLKYFEVLSYDEIAERLQLQPRTIYNQVSQALKVLRAHLKTLVCLTLFFV